MYTYHVLVTVGVDQHPPLLKTIDLSLIIFYKYCKESSGYHVIDNLPTYLTNLVFNSIYSKYSYNTIQT